MVDLSVDIAALDAFVFYAPLSRPRVNAFGRMTHRPALIVRLRDHDGVEGWGECFCNWPSFAAEHRYRLITEILAPLVVDKSFDLPSTVWSDLTKATRILRIQCDERGPFDQSIAAVDIAAWDLAARRAGIPLYQALNSDVQGVASVPVYASGLTADRALVQAQEAMAAGFSAFKLKVGFGLEGDVEAVESLRNAIGPAASLMLDANQAWEVSEAEEAITALSPYDLDWIEEPIAADFAPEQFHRLGTLGAPLAAGENVRGEASFKEMIEAGGLSVVQPDIIKWGGLTGGLRVVDLIKEYGRRYCPHYLGGGVGLMATAHLLAAAGGDGVLELDVTPNPLRTLLADPFPQLINGHFTIPQTPGLGVMPDVKNLGDFLVQGEGARRAMTEAHNQQ